ncbi:DEAD/DEAH box helicase [Rhodocytophaga rosea]|uniref:DEAD-box ATP-dependent RNA helicase RhpA n=1 Tax=Rhodocytophaga rosea TaxID=2704465 RepID=A0A6C0GJU0_9BACT|nr:DEAD/DEAH box helicase [Rhodocytophaga rosea]QHT68255.1 DEAD/DEAH box helicase [Rhodocytophaga rosea]
MKKLRFDELSLSEEIQKAVADMGFVEASPIQSEAIPYILDGRDVIGQAQTGTGKTAAFGIPALEMVDTSQKNVQVLVLCPTRELAVQVADEFKKLSKYRKDIHSVAIYGGENIEKQITALRRGVHIVIGTPGRVMDHMERRTLNLENVRMMVLDEADEMLDMGFREDIESILEQVPDERQTIFFSATMSKPIMTLTKKYQVNPQLVKVVKNELTANNIEQLFYEVKPKAKVEVMARLIDMYNLKLILVFCNTKMKVDELVEDLQIRGYQAEGLHGDLRQQQRNNVMAKFRAGATNILVATDVAARGIDVEDVDAVFNFDIPLDEEYYVHRIGRTGRAGKSGKAFSFVVGREIQRLREIQAYTKVKIERGVIPSYEDIVGVKKAKFIEKIKETISEGGLDIFADMIDQLHHAGLSNEDIILGLIKMNMGVQKNEFADMDLSGDDRSERRERRGGERERFGDRGRREDRGGSRDGRSSGRGVRENDRSTNASMVRLFINIGRDQKVRPGDIVGAIAGETGIAGNAIGSIDIYDKFSFVEVPKTDVRKVLELMDNNSIKGKKVNIEIAKQ